MPYAWDYDIHDCRPTKRRRLTEIPEMAHFIEEEEKNQVFKGEDVPLDIGTQQQQPPESPIPPKEITEEIRTSDREELMQCIKRGQRPTWVPRANFEALRAEEDALQTGKREESKTETTDRFIDDPFFGQWTDVEANTKKTRSAYHRGDFNEVDPKDLGVSGEYTGSQLEASPLSEQASSPPPWLLKSSVPPIGQAISDVTVSHTTSMAVISRRRAPSLGSSLSSSFVLRTPTSPLVNAVNNSSLDLTSQDGLHQAGSRQYNKSRRRTMPPNSFNFLHASPTDNHPPNFSRPLSGAPREPSLPQSSPQPRRSLSSFTYQPNSSPQQHFVQARRLSLASESSPRRRTSMVGSFEESIMKGRMSSPASQPFDFVAQIGVMGKGDCPASLKCPSHVTVPFQAVFYHYPSSIHNQLMSDESPSPYVGNIDLEQNLKSVQLGSKRKTVAETTSTEIAVSSDPRAPENTPIGKALAREAQRQKQCSTNPKIVLGGAYRVPQQGQLQIVIKNQNKTAVKLFLVPYDLSEMGSGTKTFVRQKSYSCGPIIEDAVACSSSMKLIHDPFKDKQILRYLIHLRFCCPAKGRYYLYDKIRAVFANRVPDGKEKLHTEIQTPEPKFSPWRPKQHSDKLSRSSTGDISGAEASIASSPGIFSMLPETKASDDILSQPQTSHPIPGDIPRLTDRAHVQGSIPLHPAAERSDITASHPSAELGLLSNTGSISPVLARALSPVQGFLPSTSARSSPVPWGTSSTTSTARSFSPTPVEAGDGLLSRQFRTLNGTSSTDTSPTSKAEKQC